MNTYERWAVSCLVVMLALVVLGCLVFTLGPILLSALDAEVARVFADIVEGLE